MPLWIPHHSPTIHIQVFDFFNFSSRVQRIKAIAFFHAYSNVVDSRPQSSPPRQNNPQFIWFAKVVCTLSIRYSPSRYSDYLSKNLNPMIAFDVIRRINDSFRNPNLALDFFQFTRVNLKLVHSLATYNFLLRSFCQMGLHDLARLLLGYMKIDGYVLDKSLLEFLVFSFANAAKFEIAKDLLIAQTQSSSDKVGVISSFVYNSLLSLLVKRNRVDEAVAFFKDHVLSSKCCGPDTCTFNVVLRGMCRVGEVDKAFGFFNDMGSFGCVPDLVTYNTLINGLCRVGNLDRACDLLREVQTQDGFSPDVVTYTSVISGYCKLGKMEEALNLFDEMTRYGIRPNSVTFNILIDGFGKSGDMFSALNMYERSLLIGCPPDVVTFTSLIDGHCRKGHVDEGLKILDEMKARSLSPNLYTFSILIHALCKENRLKEARDILRMLNLRTDIVPQPFIYNPVIDGFCKAGKIDEANAIVTEMEEKRCRPDKLTYTILILGHCMKGRMLDAISIFNKMLAFGCAPDTITIKCLISCLLKAGMANEAYKIRQNVLENLNLAVSSSRRPTACRTDMDIPVAI
ncbi:hypothetical protein LguiA_008593 [Lonicera macranthoides]